MDRHIRYDKGGLGHYGAPRGSRKHMGTDYNRIMGIPLTPGRPFPMFCTGKILRRSNPYVGTHYTGFVLDTKRARFKIFYVDFPDSLIGTVVKYGEMIGTIQDVSKNYPGSGVTPHVHIEVVMCDPEILFQNSCTKSVRGLGMDFCQSLWLATKNLFKKGR